MEKAGFLKKVMSLKEMKMKREEQIHLKISYLKRKEKK